MKDREIQELKKVMFRAIDPVIVSNIILPIEEDSKRGFIKWGENNDYPQYINSLYNDVATLKSIIDGTVDYVVGDEIHIDEGAMSSYIQQLEEYFNKATLEQQDKDYQELQKFNKNGITVDDYIRDLGIIL